MANEVHQLCLFPIRVRDHHGSSENMWCKGLTEFIETFFQPRKQWSTHRSRQQRPQHLLLAFPKTEVCEIPFLFRLDQSCRALQRLPLSQRHVAFGDFFLHFLLSLCRECPSSRRGSSSRRFGGSGSVSE